jgi:hypothetical protein
LVAFDAPGAGTGAFQGTYALGINAAGAIAGEFADASGMTHGFLRAPDGTITTIDAPGVGTGDTVAVSINSSGAITGRYFDATGEHGFLRDFDGTFTTIDPPGSISTSAAASTSGGDRGKLLGREL